MRTTYFMANRVTVECSAAASERERLIRHLRNVFGAEAVVESPQSLNIVVHANNRIWEWVKLLQIIEPNFIDRNGAIFRFF